MKKTKNKRAFNAQVNTKSQAFGYEDDSAVDVWFFCFNGVQNSRRARGLIRDLPFDGGFCMPTAQRCCVAQAAHPLGTGHVSMRPALRVPVHRVKAHASKDLLVGATSKQVKRNTCQRPI